MKQVKDSILLHRILLLLSENEYISASGLASVLETSVSTVRRKVELLDDTLKSSGYGYISKTPRKGLHLIIENSSAIPKLFSNFDFGVMAAGDQQIDNYIFVLLSSSRKRLTLNELSDQVYDSIPVVRKKLKNCEAWLEGFDLKLGIKKNYGISLNGSEENIRLAIKHLVLNNELYDIDGSIGFFAKGLDLPLLRKCISSMTREWSLKFAEESFRAVLIYAALAITRSKHTRLDISEEDRKAIEQYEEYRWSQSVFKRIEEKFFIRISEDEIVFFAIRLLCSYLLHSDEADENTVRRYDEKLRVFVTQVIAAVSNVLNVDLTGDGELYYGLLNHIRPAIFRMRFEKQDTRELSDFIKEEYKQMYRVSWALSILFEEYYGINISSTELSYIALYFQAALERCAHPVRIAIVTDLGMGFNQLFASKIKLSIPMVEKISIISYHDFTKSMIGQYDLIVTTLALPVQSEKILRMGSLLTDKEIGRIRGRIGSLSSMRQKTKTKFDPSCRLLFDPELIFTGVASKSKEDLLKQLAEKLDALGYVTKEYHASIQKREKTVSTYIGNGVAIPHGNSAFAKESRVAVAMLKTPILWDTENSVDVVFLLAFKIRSRADSGLIQLFYKGFLELIETESSLDHLRGLNQEELYQYLIT